MNIVIFYEQADWGGADSHLVELINNWPEAKDKFLILYNSGNPGIKRIKKNLKKNTKVKLKKINLLSYSSIITNFKNSYFYHLIKIFLYILRPFLFYVSYLQINIYLKKIILDYDIIMANNGGYPASWGSLAAVVAAKNNNFKSIVLLIHHAANKYSPLMVNFEKYIDKLVLNSCNKIIFVSNASKNKFLENRNINDDKNKMLVIHNQFQFKIMKKNNIIIDKMNNYRDNKNQLLFGILGRIEKYKGHDDLINGIALLEKEFYKKIKILIIGSGKDKEVSRLKKLINKKNLNDNFIFTGFLDFESREIISNLDLLFMLTKDFEGFGLTLLEAIEVKTSFISTNVGGVSEFINSNVGVLIPPESPVKIPKNIKNFIDNREFWKNRSHHAHDEFSKPKIMNIKYREALLNE